MPQDHLQLGASDAVLEGDGVGQRVLGDHQVAEGVVLVGDLRPAGVGGQVLCADVSKTNEASMTLSERSACWQRQA